MSALTPHAAALACIAYARSRRTATADRAPRVLELTAADHAEAARIRAEALTPEPLPPDDVDLTTARARVAAERLTRIADLKISRREQALSRQDVLATLRGRGWLSVIAIHALLPTASETTVKRRLRELWQLQLIERRGTNMKEATMSDVIYHSVIHCPRCSQDHAGLAFFKFVYRPITADGGMVCDWWSTCPRTGEPLLGAFGRGMPAAAEEGTNVHLDDGA